MVCLECLYYSVFWEKSKERDIWNTAFQTGGNVIKLVGRGRLRARLSAWDGQQTAAEGRSAAKIKR